MKMIARSCFISICLLMFAASIAASIAAAEEINREFHESFDAPPGTVLELRHGDGDVQIIPWEEPTLDVMVVYRGEVKTLGVGGEPGFDVSFRETGKTILVEGKESEGTSFGVRYKDMEEYTYTIHAPSHVVLETIGDDGSVRIEGWRADLTIELDDGDLYLVDILAGVTTLDLEDGDASITGLEGALFLKADDGRAMIVDSKTQKARIRMSDGDLIIKQSSGSFDVEVDDGDVRMSGVQVNSGVIRAQDGDIDMDLLASDDLDLDIQAEDGSIHLDLEAGMSVFFNAQADDGTIEIDLSAVSDLQQEKRRVEGKIHGGKGKLRVRTSDGSIVIRELEQHQ